MFFSKFNFSCYNITCSRTSTRTIDSEYECLDFFIFSDFTGKDGPQAQLDTDTFEPWTLLRKGEEFLKEKRELQALNAILLGKALLSEETRWQKALQACENLLGNKGLEDLSKLEHQFGEAFQQGAFSKFDIPIVTYSLESFGRVNIPKRWPSRWNEKYDMAQSLFLQGKNLPDIKKLCLESLKKSPRHGESWSLLARCLMVEKKYLEALAFFNQALRINKGQDEACLLKMSDAYSALGYRTLSLGMALTASLLDEKSEWGEEKTSEVLKEILN